MADYRRWIKVALKAAKAQGWGTEKGKHYKFRSPGGALVTVPTTCSDYRAALNARSALRRAGMVI